MVRALDRLRPGEVRHEHVRARPVGRTKVRGRGGQRAVAAHHHRHRRGRQSSRGDAMMRASRTPEIMGDAAYVIFTKASREFTGQFCIDDKVLYASGVRDFERYRVDPKVPLMSDFFVPDDDVPPPGVTVKALPSAGEVQKSR